MSSLTRLGEGARGGRVFSLRLLLVGMLALVAGLAIAAFAGASQVEPVPGPDNPQASDCPSGTIGWKHDPATGGTGFGDGTLVVSVDVDETDIGPTFDFTSNLPLVTVFVKGGPGSNVYAYPQVVTSDTGLHAPVNPANEKYYGLSHIVFCYVHPPGHDTTLTVIKDVVNDDGGQATAADSTIQVSGPTELTFPGAESPGTTNPVDPGDYVVSEIVGSPGYVLTISGDCDANGNVSIAAGESKTCILTNDDAPSHPSTGTVIVRKVMDGGTGTFAFSGTPSGSISANGGTISQVVSPGQHTTVEAASEGWDLVSVVCDDANSTGSVAGRSATFVVEAGETVTCTFRNAKQPEHATLIVEKVMVGGEDTFTFTGTPSGSISEDGGTISATVAAGSYSSTESAQEGWQLTSIDCDDDDSTVDLAARKANFVASAGETVTCTFTNTRMGHVIVEKTMEGGVGSFQFTGTPSGTISTNGGTISAFVTPGSHTTVEAPTAGWTLVDIDCDDSDSVASTGSRTATFNVAAGEVVTCTFHNEKHATLIVEKVMEGGEDSFAFSGTPAGSISEDGGTISATVLAGEYSSTEALKEGWELVSIDCDDEDSSGNVETRTANFDAGPGETVTCTFTNRKSGTIIVEKQTSPDGAAGSFTFSGDASGTIADGGRIVVSGLEPGTYTSTEASATGFLLTAIDCDDEDSTGNLGTRTATFHLQAGETVKCTFTNTKPTVGRGSIDVQKSVTPTVLKEPGGPVTYSVRITNTSADTVVTITSVVDDRFGSLENVAGGNPAGCFDLPIVLAPGAFATCDFPKTISGPGGTSHVNVVTASGSDQHGNPVSDSDDARVDITPRLIDLVIVKTATSPTPLNGRVTYTLTVTNKGPDPATNVQLADPAPAGIRYQSASPSQGTCAVSETLVTCSLGTIAPGQTVTIQIVGRAIAVGTHTNTATVTGDGGREQNPADNVDDAVTVVPAPITPPTPPTKPEPQPEPCLTLTVSPRMITADGRPDRVRVVVSAGSKKMKGTKVLIAGAGVRSSARTDARGIARITINPKRTGLITITAPEADRKVCGAKRIGVVGVFLPPLTG